MNFFSKYQFNMLSIGLIALVIGFLFHKPLTGEYTFGSPDSLSPSAVNQGITLSEEKYGKYPLWLPWIFSGLPSVHSFQNISDYYFPNFFITLFKSLGMPGFLSYIIHFILAGMGVFAILRELGTSRYSALFGGISFSLMPYLITMVVHGHGSQMMTTAWLPWVIWILFRLYEKTNLTNLAILGIIVGLQLQRAHVQIAYYTWMTAGLLIFMMFWNFNSSNANKSKWMLYTGLGLVLGLCMAMWIYLPAMNYTPYSIRGAGSGGGTGFEYATSWSFSPAEMATFIIPSFYGFGGVTYWGKMPFTDYPNYMGIIVLTLAVIGILFHKSKIKWYFVTTAFLALLLSFGKNFFIYQIFYDYFPYFNKFRVPAMFLILTQFSIAVLSGLGLETAFNLTTSSKTNISFKKLLGVVLSIIVLLFLLKLFYIPKPGYFPKYPQSNLPSAIIMNIDNLRLYMINSDMIKSLIFLFTGCAAYYINRQDWIGKRLLCGIIIMVSIIDMSFVNKNIIEPSKNSYRQSTITKKSFHSSFLRTDEVIRFLQKDKSQFRILPLQPLQQTNRWSAFHIESIEGYHPAKIYRYNQLKNEVGWNSLGVLQMLNVKYIISLEDLLHPAFEIVFSGKLFHKGEYQNANVYQFKYFMPRAFFVDKIQKIYDKKIQLEVLRENGFNPLTQSFIEHDPYDFEYSAFAKVNISHWTPDKIEFELDVPSKQFMLLSEIFYPEGWKITSHPDWKIYPVNTILRGIYIPSGSHRMIMEFIPNDIFFGSLLTWGSTAIIMLLILSGIFIKRKEDAE